MSNEPKTPKAEEVTPQVETPKEPAVETPEVPKTPEVETPKEETPETEKSEANATMEKLNSLDKAIEKKAEEPKTEEIETPVEKADFSKMSEIVKTQGAHITNLQTQVGKMASIIEKLFARVEAVESEPAQPKTMHTYAVEQPTNKSETPVSGRVGEIDKRLGELMAIRESNLEKFQMDHVDEAQKLMDEKAVLIRQQQ